MPLLLLSLLATIPAALIDDAAPARGAAAAAGLVAAYGFSEGSGTTVADSSGNNNAGTISGATWTGSGKYGSGLLFSGSNAKVTVPDSASLHLTAGMTLEAWVNPSTTSSAWRDVIYKGNDNYYLEGTSSSSGKPAGGAIAGGSYAEAFGTSALTANTFSYLAVSYDGATVRLYVNGTQVASTAHTGTIATSTNPLQIGGDNLYGQYFQGTIDEVRVYSTALTQTQVQTDMNTPIAPDTQPPTAPSGLGATAFSPSQINLGWTASQDNVGVTGYQIERCQAAGCSNFAPLTTVPGTQTTYSDTGLTANTSYSYRVRATDAAGNLSPYSNTATTSTLAPDSQPPTAPSTLTATAAGSTQINLGWQASQDNVGVTNYLVERCQGAGCSNFSQIGTSTQTTYNDTGLAPNTSYSYRVRATDAAGNLSPYSNTATTSTQAGTAGLVAAYGFSEGSGTTVADSSGNNNAGTISGATWTGSGKYGSGLLFSGSNAKVTVPDSASLHLTAGMTLEAWVNPSTTSSAWRDVIYKGNDNYYLEGTSSSSGKPAGGAIAGGSYAEAFGTSALTANTFSYLAVSYDGATVRLYVNGTQVASTAHTGTIATSTNPLQIGGDNLYGQYFQGTIDEVRVYSTALTQTQVQTDMNTPIAPDTQPPTAPSGLGATAFSPSQINLGWTASQDNVGVTGYQIERCQAAGCSNFAPLTTVPGTQTTYSDTGLTANTSYSYRVRATDAAGNLSPYSNTATTSTLAPDSQPPTAPSTLTATAAGSTQINLGWQASQDNVGVTNYLVERCQGAGCSNFSQIGTSTQTTYNDTGLAPNTSYSYRVRATDAAGNLSPYSNTATTSTQAGTAGLVAAYGFDEGSGTTVADSSGNNNGTISGATWTSSGKYGNALVFNGSARITVPDAPSLDLTSRMTLEAWVNPSTVSSAWRDVIYKGQDNYYLEATSSNASVPAGGGTIGGTNSVASAPGALAAGAWTFLAVTYDGSNVRLYINGSRVATQAATGNITTSTNPLQIGGDNLYGQYFQGTIDEARVYNAALSQTQVYSDMLAEVNSATAPNNLSASAVSGTQVNLSWQAPTTPGVTSYAIERCVGATCSNFVQIGTTAATTFSNTNLTAQTSYSYRVRALYGASPGGYSNVASAFTGLSVTPRAVAVTFTSTQQFTAQGPGSGSVTWSVDGVAGGNASVGTITAGGLYTPPAAVGTHTVTAKINGQSQTASATVYVTHDPGVFTFHDDAMRTGQNLTETALSPSNVNQQSFGKVGTFALDGLTYASPVYVPGVNIPGKGVHDVVFVATEHDSLYALDADNPGSPPLWQDSFINPAAGVTTVPAADTGETVDIPNEIGITSTPVVDPSTGTIYVVVKTKEVLGGQTNYVQRLHALDIGTGTEKFGGPVVIQASVPGTGIGSVNGQLAFDPLRENQRAGLLFANGKVYMAFSSHGDHDPFHGWVLGYNASNVQQQTLVFCSTPNDEHAGIWMDGNGLATDQTGSLYFITGDGGLSATSGGSDYGDAFVRMTPAGSVTDWFSPSVQTQLDADNLDLGSGGVLLLPDQPGAHPHEMVSAGKNGTIYLVDRDNMGHYDPNTDHIVQSIVNIFTAQGGEDGGNFSSPAYFNGNVYFAPVSDHVQAFHLSNGLLTTTPTSETSEVYTGRGGTMSISANGATNGIVWTLQSNGTAPGVLHAYDATNLVNQLYNSNQAGSRDVLESWSKFSLPVVADGKVFVATTSTLAVYGLLP